MLGKYLFAAMLMSISFSAKAQTINLSCNGTFLAPGKPPINADIFNQGVQVDLTKKQIFGLNKVVIPIIRMGETDIGFRRPYIFDNGTVGYIGGSLDRITGHLDYSGIEDPKSMTVAFLYKLECRPAQPLF